MTIALILCIPLAAMAGWSLREPKEETRVRCWICGRTFSNQTGLTWHSTATHPYDDSETYDKKGKVYR